MQKDKISMKKSILLVLAAIIVVILVGGQIFFTTNHLEYGSVYITSLKTLALREDFVGVRTSQGIEEGLYTLKETGVSTQPIMDAAEDFLASLDTKQRERTIFPIDDIAWRNWSNFDAGYDVRNGVGLREMSDEQKEKAFSLMQASLSAEGYEQVRNIMKTDHTLKEYNNGIEALGEDLYYFNIFGEPSQTDPWGWQVEGHHLALHFFILGDQLVFSPVLLGAEPAIADFGKYEGNTVLQDEQNLGLTLMQSLPAEQQLQALTDQKHRDDLVAGAFADNLVLDYEGVKVSEMSPENKELLINLIGQYIGHLRDGHAEVTMEEILEHIDDTWFSWKGEYGVEPVFYYRIHSPVILIEFDHQGPIRLVLPDVDVNLPIRNHIHTMLRTPNGNDYGKDLLRQHLELHHSE